MYVICIRKGYRDWFLSEEKIVDCVEKATIYNLGNALDKLDLFDNAYLIPIK